MLRGFLSNAECDHLIALAEAELRPSDVVDSSTGKSVMDEVRTSFGMFLQQAQDDVVAEIETRLAGITLVPFSHGEALQILRYEDGQKYEPHNDFFWDLQNSDPAMGGQRVATVLAYLTTPEEGGETVFPQGRADGSTDGPEWSPCARGNLAVKATRGDALLFYSMTPTGEPDGTSLHASCPTLKGRKYSMTKWSHVYPYNAGMYQRRDAKDYYGCRNIHPRCQEYFEDTRCINSAKVMYGICPKACGRCAPRGPGQAHAWASRQATPPLDPSVDIFSGKVGAEVDSNPEEVLTEEIQEAFTADDYADVV
jgi:prolyl 4-hydroxylase